MFGIGLPELFIILVIALVVLGPEKLPDLARAIGRGLGEFRKATDELKHSFNEDDELRALKKSLTEARDEMSGFVRESTKNVSTENLTKSLSDGSFFDQKPSEKDENNKGSEASVSDDNVAVNQAESVKTTAEGKPLSSENDAEPLCVPDDDSKPSDTPSPIMPETDSK
jgi:Tat protein translocase TatB subunit